MGWIPASEIACWFDLHDIPESNRLWYYARISAIDSAYLSEKEELAKKD